MCLVSKLFLESLIDNNKLNCAMFIICDGCIICGNKVFNEEFNINNTMFHIYETGEIGLKHKTGDIVVFYRTMTGLYNNIGEVSLYQDKTKEKLHWSVVNTLLHTDALTKLPNRAKLIEDLRNDTNNNIRDIAILDINGFKEISDFYGHAVGDCILTGVASFIQNNIPNGVSLYKSHSDTYCLTNQDLAFDKFKESVLHLLTMLEQHIFHCDSFEIDLRITAGMSHSKKNNKLITADIALQAAKKNNKSLIVFDDDLDNLEEYRNNIAWSKKIKTAILEDRIIVHFQPIINNETLKIVKYECLVRMLDGDRIISPFFFLEVAKKSNQYTKLTKIIIEKSFQTFEYLSFDFSINISYDDIEQEWFLDFIKSMIKKYNTHDIAKRVVFEILEDQSIKNYDILKNFISEVKALGCKIAIDDFGSGYSNFEHIIKMNVDYLKIDASLIKNIATDDNSQKVTQTIVDFAKKLNLKTIAEYVENESIFNITREMGVDFSQGYYFSPPVHTINFKGEKK